METTRVCAPVALFVYNRPWHTRKTVEALLMNAEASATPLFVYSDAAKNELAASGVAEVRAYLHTIQGFFSVQIVEREVNYGLARSITNGVSALCSEYGRVIVLEDDLLTSPDFLRFMNQGLSLYEDDTSVASIHGYAYPIIGGREAPETYFLRGADCWGWATWDRAWRHFEPDGAKLLESIKCQKLSYRFDFDGNSSYMRMLRNQIKGWNDSWAIRWHASAFLDNMLTLYPRESLVTNIGFDDSGTHCGTADYFSVGLGMAPATLKKIDIIENEEMRAQVVRFFRGVKWARYRSVWRRIGPMLHRSLRGLFRKFGKIIELESRGSW